MATIGDTFNELWNQARAKEGVTFGGEILGFPFTNEDRIQADSARLSFENSTKEDHRTACFVFLFDMLVEEGVEAKEAAELALRVIGGYGLS